MSIEVRFSRPRDKKGKVVASVRGRTITPGEGAEAVAAALGELRNDRDTELSRQAWEQVLLDIEERCAEEATLRISKVKAGVKIGLNLDGQIVFSGTDLDELLIRLGNLSPRTDHQEFGY